MCFLSPHCHKRSLFTLTRPLADITWHHNTFFELRAWKQTVMSHDVCKRYVECAEHPLLQFAFLCEICAFILIRMSHDKTLLRFTVNCEHIFTFVKETSYKTCLKFSMIFAECLSLWISDDINNFFMNIICRFFNSY